MSLTSRAHYRPGTAQAFKLALDGIGRDAAGEQELVRLTNALKLKERVSDDQLKEIATLRAKLAVAQRALSAQQSEVDVAKEKALQSEGGAAASTKELAVVKADKKKLEAQVADLMRQNAKLRDEIARSSNKSPGIAAQVVELQGQARAARAAADKAGEEVKALENLVRAKDKEMARQAKKVEEAELVLQANGVLTNQVLELEKELEEARAENKTLGHVCRTREADIARLNAEMDGLRAQLRATQGQLADTSASYKAAQGKVNDLEAEVGVLRDDLARTGAVAARVAAAEVKAGSKTEGTISIMQHIEECKYLNGEIGRLKDKISSLEKQLAVADELKDKYRTAAERSGGTRLSFGGGAELPGGGLAAGAAAGATSGSQSSRRASFAGNQVTRALLVGATPPSAPRSTSAVRGVSAGGRSSLGGGAQGLQGVQEEGAASAGPKRAFLRKGTGGAGIVRQTADDDVLASIKDVYCSPRTLAATVL